MQIFMLHLLFLNWAWKIFLEQKFLLQKGALRNLIDIEDVRDLLELAIPHAEKLNLISFALPHSTEVSIIVDFLEEAIGNSGIYEEKEVISSYQYKESEFLKDMISSEDKLNSKTYCRNTILKYYGAFPENFIWLSAVF